MHLTHLHGRRPGQIVPLPSAPSGTYSVTIPPVTVAGPTWWGVASILGVGLAGLAFVRWTQA